MNDKDSKKQLPTCLQQAGIENGVFSSSSLELREVPGTTVVRLHSLGNSEQLKTAVDEAGIELLQQTGQSSGQDPVVLCLRPKEYLLFSEQLEPEQLIEQLEPLIDPTETSLFNNSDGLGTFRLSGPGAPWLLSKLSGLDFTVGTEQGQHCTRTRMAHAAVVINYHQTGNDDSPFVFDLLFDRSLAKYIWDLLTASANHADDLVSAFGNAA